MSRPFSIGRFSATPDDSGERDGWWLGVKGLNPDGDIFIAGRELPKLRRLLERVEKYEARRPKRRAA